MSGGDAAQRSSTLEARVLTTARRGFRVGPVTGVWRPRAAAVAAVAAVLLVVGVNGTGKTTTLVEAAVARLGSGRSPLVLTFSRRAAADLRERITARLGHSTTTPAAMTFHSFCHALLRRFGEGAADPGHQIIPHSVVLT